MQSGYGNKLYLIFFFIYHLKKFVRSVIRTFARGKKKIKTLNFFLLSDQNDVHLLRCLLFIRLALYVPCRPIHFGFDGYLRSRICCIMDCVLGMCWIYVDLWIQKFLQRYQADDWKWTRDFLEGLLGWNRAYFLVDYSYCLSCNLGRSKVSTI